MKKWGKHVLGERIGVCGRPKHNWDSLWKEEEHRIEGREEGEAGEEKWHHIMKDLAKQTEWFGLHSEGVREWHCHQLSLEGKIYVNHELDGWKRDELESYLQISFILEPICQACASNWVLDHRCWSSLVIFTTHCQDHTIESRNNASGLPRNVDNR
jgi:hypothetical protein